MNQISWIFLFGLFIGILATGSGQTCQVLRKFSKLVPTNITVESLVRKKCDYRDTKCKLAVKKNVTEVRYVQGFEYRNETECCEGYRLISRSPLTCKFTCKKKIEHGRCSGPNEYTCHDGYSLLQDQGLVKCIPKCDKCQHGTCTGPNICRCFNGYQSNSGSCEPICSSGCPNGKCVSPEVCQCDNEYELNGENICEPGVDLKAKLHCSATCINGICSKSHECQCNPGYEISETGFCVEKCILDCKNGKCANQECWCNAGYSLSENDTTVCLPVCINPCANGNCVEPNKCKCLEGYEFKNESQFECEPGLELKAKFQCQKICDNGHCSDSNECICNAGFELHENGTCTKICSLSCKFGRCLNNGCQCDTGYALSKDDPEVCEPVCDPECLNGICSDLHQCICNEEFELHLNGSCIEKCKISCSFGECLNNKCKCIDGYSLSEDSSTICEPICNTDCKNGDCEAPDRCKCWEGYEQQDQFTCLEPVPAVVQRSPDFYMDSETLEYITLTSELPSSHEICDFECHNGECIKDNKCQCLTGYLKINETHCGPECDPHCLNGVCIGPNKCLCDEAFQTLFDAQCKPKCDQPCINGTCVGTNECECHKDFYINPNDSLWYSCVPKDLVQSIGVCKQMCKNGKCSEGTCICDEGFGASDGPYDCLPLKLIECHDICNNGVCDEDTFECECLEDYVYREGYCQELLHCDTDCSNGKCSGMNECTCDAGYQLSNEDWYICDPICQLGVEVQCKNGHCVAPNICRCNEGFLRQSNNFTCLEEIVQPAEPPLTEKPINVAQSSDIYRSAINGTMTILIVVSALIFLIFITITSILYRKYSKKHYPVDKKETSHNAVYFTKSDEVTIEA